MIELKNITFKVQENGNEKVILNNISCKFEDNCLTAITGQNGSGKSTLTKLIVGILSPSSGKILLDGKDITKLSIFDRSKMGINYAFQQPITFKGISIKNLIDIATNKTNSFSEACEHLSKVGICAKEYINRDFDKTLSGGEQKRIELALAIAKPGNNLIFDEPEAGIDLWSFDKLNSIFDKTKCTIVVSHQEKLLKQADKILVLEKGEIVYFDKSSTVLSKIGNRTCKKIGGENATR